MIERLVDDALKSNYYKKIYSEIVECFCSGMFPVNDNCLTTKELRDALRFADIFSNSNREEIRNIAYRLISMLYEKYKENCIYIMYSNAILKKLDNFPALKKIKNFNLPIEREIQHLIHKDILKSPIGEEYFLPNQYNIYKYMDSGKSLTFSGPTSMGKSFIIKQFIFNMVKRNFKRNFCIIVPTRALIKQYVMDLNRELIQYKDYKILTNANVLEFIEIEENNYIFVLTQERLNVLLYSKYNIKIDYIFVDEAHKIFDNDTRALTFYTSIDSCLLKNKNISIFFASPLIQNPEIFSEAYNKKNLYKYKSNESPVNQNLFYVDLKEKKVELIENGESIWRWTWNDYFKHREDMFYKVGRDCSNIIYLSSKEKVVEYAMTFVEFLEKNNMNLVKNEDRDEINNICSVIESNIHKEYHLIKSLKYGIAYHYGKIPSIVKESIEELFRKGVVKYIFCTSTLLEGVNLPAKNIFVMANYKGNCKMKALDFWNLSGRAGRLGYEYYGNVFCVNDYSRRGAWKDKSIFSEKFNIKLEDVLIKNLKNNKDDIKEIISSEDPKEESKKIEKYNNYLSNIIQIDSISNSESTIVNKANNIDSMIIEMCPERENYINYDIVNSSKNIDYKIQKSIFKDEKLIPLDNTINYASCKKLINFMYDKYRWDIKEERLHSRTTMEYIALLMALWMNGKPLNEIINSSIEYKKRNHKSIRKSSGEWIAFNYRSVKHINILINNVIEDIDDVLRFDLEKYFTHYFNVLVDKYGEDELGVNWALYLEFGTRDMQNIILQNAGFSRYVSTVLLKQYSKYIIFDNNILVGIEEKILSDVLDNKVIYRELENSSYLIE